MTQDKEIKLKFLSTQIQINYTLDKIQAYQTIKRLKIELK